MAVTNIAELNALVEGSSKAQLKRESFFSKSVKQRPDFPT
ncbi:hypothetical protein KAM622c_20740 [Klebsiella quasipneumoniae subsp. quasipneumoniae]|nr:hypothetical protein KAM622c_20740 [Klebsiella quasipneumoniae subsp. quasipneumoniae]